jgi:hypothetical protein
MDETDARDGLPLLLLALPATFLLDPGSIPTRVAKKFAAFGGTLVLLAGTFYLIILMLERAFLPYTTP